MARQRLPKIFNQTEIRGDDLRRLVQRAYSTLIYGPEAEPMVYLVRSITFRYSEDTRSRGWIWCGTPWDEIVIEVRNNFVGKPRQARDICQILEHELAHAKGYDHGPHMPTWWTLDVSWAEGAKIRLKKTAWKSIVEKQVRRLAA